MASVKGYPHPGRRAGSAGPIVPWSYYVPSPKTVRQRDRPHVGVMRNGQCRSCWGWVDDPRHTEIVFAKGE